LSDRVGRGMIIDPQMEIGLVKFAYPGLPITSLLQGVSEIPRVFTEEAGKTACALQIDKNEMLAKHLDYTQVI